jgi:glycine/D-amino acid oxidase-like deaminating enzyme/nitrite reductase/ring-hydroxylating ferredoxin subunit
LSVNTAIEGGDMTKRSGAHLDVTSLWIESTPLPRFPKLERDGHADVVVVGGGITGLTCAYLLTQAGRSVVLIERQRCASVDTGHTTAHLTMATDTRLKDLVKKFGRNHAQATWDAGLAAIAQIERIAGEEQIACDFARVPGHLHAPLDGTATDAASLEEDASLANELGFDAEFMPQVPFIGQPGILFPEQARFHPRKYLAGLMKVITERGGKIYEESSAEEFLDSPLRVKANGHTIACGDVVIATHSPLVGVRGIVGATLFQTKLALYTSYVLAARVPRGQIPDALFWDTADPYHYLRLEPHRDHDAVIFGGEDHKTGQAEDTTRCFDALERTLKTLVPKCTITHRWSGQVIETPDGLPYIGQTAEHQYAATGFAGNGMTLGTLSAMMITDALLGRTNPWAELFDTGRTKIRGGAWDYIRENKDYLYYLIRDRFAGAEGKSLRALKRGEGRILDLRGQRVAAYRDEHGKTTVRSAICTHMGCTVDWNEAEKTWDCPCHGSRFKPTGEVLAGPAESPLSDAEPKRA